MNFVTFDASYVSKLRAGDAPTEQHFVTYFSELILLKLRPRLRRAEQIEDVKQETFSRTLSLIRSEGGLRHAERLGPLVNSICNNVLFEYYRLAAHDGPLDDEEEKEVLAIRPDALDAIDSKELEKKVREILQKLPERDRRLLREVFLEERDKDEVCRELGVDRDYLRVLLHRAKQAFKSSYLKHMRIPLRKPWNAAMWCL